MKALRKYWFCFLLFCGLASPTYAEDLQVAKICTNATIAAADHIGAGGDKTGAQELFARIASKSKVLNDKFIEPCRGYAFIDEITTGVSLAGGAVIKSAGGVDGFLVYLSGASKDLPISH